MPILEQIFMYLALAWAASLFVFEVGDSWLDRVLGARPVREWVFGVLTFSLVLAFFACLVP